MGFQLCIFGAILLFSKSIVCPPNRDFPSFPGLPSFGQPGFPGFPAMPGLPKVPLGSENKSHSVGGKHSETDLAPPLPPATVPPVDESEVGEKIPKTKPVPATDDVGELTDSSPKGPRKVLKYANASSFTHAAKVTSMDGGEFTAKLKEKDSTGKSVNKNVTGRVYVGEEAVDVGDVSKIFQMGKFKNRTSELETEGKVVSAKHGVGGGKLAGGELLISEVVNGGPDSPSNFTFDEDDTKCREAFGTGDGCTSQQWETCKSNKPADEEKVYCMKSGNSIYKCHVDCMREPCGKEGCLDEDKFGQPESKIAKGGACDGKKA